MLPRRHSRGRKQHLEAPQYEPEQELPHTAQARAGIFKLCVAAVVLYKLLVKHQHRTFLTLHAIASVARMIVARRKAAEVTNKSRLYMPLEIMLATESLAALVSTLFWSDSRRGTSPRHINCHSPDKKRLLASGPQRVLLIAKPLRQQAPLLVQGLR